MIISPCNGMKRCFRHPSGCARIVMAPREEYASRQNYKARRRRLWNIVRRHFLIGIKWGLDPIPPQYHLYAVLLMEEVFMDTKLSMELNKES